MIFFKKFTGHAPVHILTGVKLKLMHIGNEKERLLTTVMVFSIFLACLSKWYIVKRTFFMVFKAIEQSNKQKKLSPFPVQYQSNPSPIPVQSLF